MIEGEGSWRSQGRDVSCLITMSSASLRPNTNSEANALPAHRCSPECTTGSKCSRSLATLSQYLSDIVERRRLPSKKGEVRANLSIRVL